MKEFIITEFCKSRKSIKVVIYLFQIFMHCIESLLFWYASSLLYNFSTPLYYFPLRNFVTRAVAISVIIPWLQPLSAFSWILVFIVHNLHSYSSICPTTRILQWRTSEFCDMLARFPESRVLRKEVRKLVKRYDDFVKK